jgi:hypothetical protein
MTPEEADTLARVALTAATYLILGDNAGMIAAKVFFGPKERPSKVIEWIR